MATSQRGGDKRKGGARGVGGGVKRGMKQTMTRDNAWVWVSCRASFQDLVDQLCHSQKNGQDKHPETGSWDKDNTTGRDIERRHTVRFSEVVV